MMTRLNMEVIDQRTVASIASSLSFLRSLPRPT
jgi:hypothetical protein